MKQITNFIGIDISKKTLDFCLIEEDGVLKEINIDNQEEAIVNTLKSLFEEQKLTVENTLICAEHTGHYTNTLSDVMRSNKYLFWLADPYTFKHSQGIKRGKK
jgi:transposase